LGSQTPHERGGPSPIHRRGRAADPGAGAHRARPSPREEVPLTARESFNLAVALVDARCEEGLGGKTAIRFEGRSLTYADVAHAANRAGNAFRDLGLEPEQRVALILRDSPEFVASFLGAIKIGAIPVTLSTLLTSRDYLYLLADCRARALVIDASLRPHIEPIRAHLSALRHLITVGSADAAVSFEQLTATASAELDPEPTAPDDMCFWQYSSGTTGAPKAVIHLQRSALAPADLHGRYVVGMRSEDRVFSVAKLFFSYGLNNSLVIPFRHGATTVLFPGRPEPRAVFATVSEERPTVLYAVPTAYAAMLASSEPADLSSVRVCVSAGEALPRPVFERWNARFGLEILDGIGSTEIGYIAISNFAGRVRAGTSGTVVPGYEARVVDETGSAVPPNTVGDLLVRGPSSALCYWNNRAATKRAFRGEWVFTGDRYSVDADGYHTYHGRSDDLLKVGGMWVSPLEVETALLEHAAVLECAVVGREDADGLVKPAAYVVARNGAETATLADELTRFVKDRLAPYKYPRWVEFMDELPKTSTGKIQRFKLRTH
jgi:benzoate-CoA ligase family protein